MKQIIIILSIFIGMGCTSKAEANSAKEDTTSLSISKSTNENSEAKANKSSQTEGDNSIEFTDMVAYLAIIISVLGFLLTCLTFKKLVAHKRKENRNFEKNIAKAIKEDATIRHTISKVINSQVTMQKVATPGQIELAINSLVNTPKFNDLLQHAISKQLAEEIQKRQKDLAEKVKEVEKVKETKEATETKEAAETKETPKTQQPAPMPAKITLYAKESRNKFLTNIQESYQKGKSLYKLELSKPNDLHADLDICIDREEVKQRIFKYDSEYLEPVCEVHRLSSTPTEVVVISKGEAERKEDTWNVIKSIIVELK